MSEKYGAIDEKALREHQKDMFIESGRHIIEEKMKEIEKEYRLPSGMLSESLRAELNSYSTTSRATGRTDKTDEIIAWLEDPANDAIATYYGINKVGVMAIEAMLKHQDQWWNKKRIEEKKRSHGI